MNFMFGLPSIDGKYDIHVTKSIVNQFPYIVAGGHTVECSLVHNTLIHNARNMIAKNALEHESDYLFFIDSDCVIPSDALKTLAGYNKDIVCGMYFQKKPPFAPVIYEENAKGTYDVIIDYPVRTLLEVDGVGLGVCLIKTDVFKKLGCDCFDALPENGDHPAINGEDLAFCKRAREAGYKIYADTGLQALHQTVRYIDEQYYIKAMQKEIQLKEKENGNHPTTGGGECPTTGTGTGTDDNR